MSARFSELHLQWVSLENVNASVGISGESNLTEVSPAVMMGLLRVLPVNVFKDDFVIIKAGLLGKSLVASV